MRDALDTPPSVSVSHAAHDVLADFVIDIIWDQVRDNVWDQVSGALGDAVRHETREEVERIR